MQSNRGRDTAPELAVRRRLHVMGLRYRVSVRPVPNLRRTADIVFTRARIAVFIDGCFRHGCPEHYQAPVRNGDFWLAKRKRNGERDAETFNSVRRGLDTAPILGARGSRRCFTRGCKHPRGDALLCTLTLRRCLRASTQVPE